MPSFVSKNGVWKPAKEKVYIQPSQSADPKVRKAALEGLTEDREYEGPDREAVAIIKEKTGSEHGTLGMASDKNPENIMRARQLGMSVQEWLKMNEPPTEEQLKAEAEKDNLVVTHKPGRRKKGVSTGDGAFGDFKKYVPKESE